MPARRPPKGYQRISLQLPAELIKYLDQQAKRQTITRPAVVRQLIMAARSDRPAA
jgi:metal-responsive CopG/Arc/MetJ family transcriptional regulator